ncbi:MAG: succinate--CoA ligase subunit alpha [Thermotogota bacterium]
MSILVDESTRVLVQGITGKVGSFQAQVMKDYGTRVVAGVTPGKGGTLVHEIPVYNLVEQAVKVGPVDAALSFVPARSAKDAAIEVIDNGIPLLVLSAGEIPDHDVMAIIRFASSRGTRVVGPDTPGIVSPGKCKVGVHPNRVLLPGAVGIVSKSGALSYEVCKRLTESGIGQSTVVGIGGGPLWGTTQRDALALFEADPETRAVILLGEVGGTMEQEAAEFVRTRMKKPVIVLIVGRAAPVGARMGHAGAIVEGETETAEAKLAALEQAGCMVTRNPAEIVPLLRKLEGGNAP